MTPTTEDAPATAPQHPALTQQARDDYETIAKILLQVDDLKRPIEAMQDRNVAMRRARHRLTLLWADLTAALLEVEE